MAAKRLEAKTKREKEERQRAIDSEKNRQSIHASAQELKEKREKYEMVWIFILLYIRVCCICDLTR